MVVFSCDSSNSSEHKKAIHIDSSSKISAHSFSNVDQIHTKHLSLELDVNFKNKTFGDYTNSQTPISKNIMFSALAGTMWFLQFFFYGMGESKLGNGASSWILHMATIILTANFWGFYLKEWTGVSKKTFNTFLVGIGLILASIVIVGVGNSL